MEQTIYADILFLIDVSMDFLALYVTAFFLKIKFKSGNCILAAALGAIYSVISVIFGVDSVIAAVAVSVVMCVIAYYGNGTKTVLKSILFFYIVNMLLGGVMTAIFNVFNTITDGNTELLIYGEHNTVSDNMPFIVFIACFAAILLIFKLIKRIITASPSKVNRSVYITVGAKTERITAIEDSGNRVVEPISCEPIIFLKQAAVERLGGQRLLSALKMKDEFLNGRDRHKYRVVFYQTVSGSDMCVCFKPDKIRIDGKEASAWIAIGRSINKEGIDGIVPSSLLI
ncbi:MAG: sigma-E processing peptidase SpoIIGA [Clostridia bacterium]|nr:sigma-E processing peptidase SpoIIGA [Clostridia bacterium]